MPLKYFIQGLGNFFIIFTFALMKLWEINRHDVFSAEPLTSKCLYTCDTKFTPVATACYSLAPTAQQSWTVSPAITGSQHISMLWLIGLKEKCFLLCGIPHHRWTANDRGWYWSFPDSLMSHQRRDRNQGYRGLLFTRTSSLLHRTRPGEHLPLEVLPPGRLHFTARSWGLLNTRRRKVGKSITN